MPGPSDQWSVELTGYVGNTATQVFLTVSTNSPFAWDDANNEWSGSWNVTDSTWSGSNWLFTVKLKQGPATYGSMLTAYITVPPLGLVDFPIMSRQMFEEFENFEFSSRFYRSGLFNGNGENKGAGLQFNLHNDCDSFDSGDLRQGFAGCHETFNVTYKLISNDGLSTQTIGPYTVNKSTASSSNHRWIGSQQSETLTIDWAYRNAASQTILFSSGDTLTFTPEILFDDGGLGVEYGLLGEENFFAHDKGLFQNIQEVNWNSNDSELFVLNGARVGFSSANVEIIGTKVTTPTIINGEDWRQQNFGLSWDSNLRWCKEFNDSPATDWATDDGFNVGLSNMEVASGTLRKIPSSGSNTASSTRVARRKHNFTDPDTGPDGVIINLDFYESADPFETNGSGTRRITHVPFPGLSVIYERVAGYGFLSEAGATVAWRRDKLILSTGVVTIDSLEQLSYSGVTPFYSPGAEFQLVIDVDFKTISDICDPARGSRKPTINFLPTVSVVRKSDSAVFGPIGEPNSIGEMTTQSWVKCPRYSKTGSNPVVLENGQTTFSYSAPAPIGAVSPGGSPVLPDVDFYFDDYEWNYY